MYDGVSMQGYANGHIPDTQAKDIVYFLAHHPANH